jgi:hypothetical protein
MPKKKLGKTDSVQFLKDVCCIILIAFFIAEIIFEAFFQDPFLTKTNSVILGGYAIVSVLLCIISISRAIEHIRRLYGSKNAQNLETFSFGQLLFQVTVSYGLLVVCFALIYYVLSIYEAFNLSLNLMDGLYFSIVTITTTGFGDLTPKTRLAKAFVSTEILFGVAYAVLIFSVLAGYARRAGDSRSPS